jgi:putative ABC transport system permease protein
MKIPLIAGRFFIPADREETEKVAVVSQTFARRYWSDQDAIGKRVRMVSSPGENKNPWYTIVGVVSDVKQNGLDSGHTTQLYFPVTQFDSFALNLLVRTASNPAQMTATIQKAIRDIDKDQAGFNVATMQQVLSNSISLRTFSMFLFGVFSALALILATIGIYGVISYSVAQRVHEIGIRMALGAAQRDVLKMVIRSGLILAMVGIGIGMGVSFGLTRLLSSLLFGVTPTDPLTFVIIVLMLAAVAILASYIPARRASKVDPMVALRYE